MKLSSSMASCQTGSSSLPSSVGAPGRRGASTAYCPGGTRPSSVTGVSGVCGAGVPGAAVCCPWAERATCSSSNRMTTLLFIISPDVLCPDWIPLPTRRIHGDRTIPAMKSGKEAYLLQLFRSDRFRRGSSEVRFLSPECRLVAQTGQEARKKRGQAPKIALRPSPGSIDTRANKRKLHLPGTRGLPEIAALPEGFLRGRD